LILRSRFEDCEVIAVKRQRDSNFFTARFLNCRFKGVFSGIDFGRSHSIERDGDFGGIENCDFTAATLDGCRFVNADVSTLRLPAWPHAVLLDPYKRAADVAQMQWPGLLGLYMKGCTEMPESFKATVLHMPSLAPLVQCTEEQVQEALKRLGGLQM